MKNKLKTDFKKVVHVYFTGGGQITFKMKPEEFKEFESLFRVGGVFSADGFVIDMNKIDFYKEA